MSLILTVVGATAPMALAQLGVDLTANPKNEPFPITVDAKPSTVLVGTPVELSGITVALLNTDVVLTIASTKATPSQSSKLLATRSADGSFKLSFVPKVAGTYTVDAMAPDGKGHGSASFTVEDPHQLSTPTARGLIDLAADVDELIPLVKGKLDNLPASPARDEAEQQLISLGGGIVEFKRVAQEASDDTGQLIKATATPPANLAPGSNAPGNSGGGNFTMGGGGSVAGNMQVTLSKFVADRQAVVEMLGQASQIHQRTQEEVAKLRSEEVTCDNLEKAAEGIKLASALFNFVGNGIGIATSFAKDVIASYVSNGIKMIGNQNGTALGAFVAGEFVKNGTGMLSLLNNLHSKATDLAGFLMDNVMAKYCEQFTGPVKAHMHATFMDQGRKWWEYSFDAVGQITLHYPKGATSGSVPLKGRIEGLATNYKVWENALNVMYPELMGSTVQMRYYVLPIASQNHLQTYVWSKMRDIEGSVMGAAVTPSSFFFEVTGTATPNQLDIRIGPQHIDTKNSVKVIELYLPVLSLSIGYAFYSLPYKPVHFIFERANGYYPIPLTTQKTVIRGKQHFENKISGSVAQGEYSVDLEACNPDC